MYLIKAASKTRGVLMRYQLSKYHKGPIFYSKTVGYAKHVTNGANLESVTARSAGREPQTLSTASPPQRLCTPCPYPTTYVPDIHQFTPQEYAELALHFHGRIKDLWRKVWFGLYQVQDKNGPCHASQIRKLYASTGMAELLDSRIGGRCRMHDMYKLFWGRWEMIGLGDLSTALYENVPGRRQPVLAQLKIYDGIALDNLQFIVMILKDYEYQVEAVLELYSFLQQHQLDGNTTAEDGRESTMARQTFLLREFRKRADTIAAALAILDKQMLDLQTDMENEAREIYGDRLEGVETMLVRDEVLSSE